MQRFPAVSLLNVSKIDYRACKSREFWVNFHALYTSSEVT